MPSGTDKPILAEIESADTLLTSLKSLVEEGPSLPALVAAKTLVSLDRITAQLTRHRDAIRAVRGSDGAGGRRSA